MNFDTNAHRTTRLLRRVALSAATLLMSAAGCKQEPEINWEHRYQEHADRVRVKQLHDLAALIERFHAAKGYYPLTQGVTGPVDVAITRQPLQGVASNRSIEQLEQELSAGLGETIALPRDPQMHDLLGFRVFHYHAEASSYAVYTHLYFASPLTEPVDEATHTHRFTLIHSPGPSAKVPAWTKEDRDFVRDGDEERAKEKAAASKPSK